jgi:transaldolase
MVASSIDSADRADVIRLLANGLLAGVTTNPAILKKVDLGSRHIPAAMKWAVDAGAERVFIQPMINLEPNSPERGEWTSATHFKSMTEEDGR